MVDKWQLSDNTKRRLTWEMQCDGMDYYCWKYLSHWRQRGISGHILGEKVSMWLIQLEYK